jgi:hypothetical protein
MEIWNKTEHDYHGLTKENIRDRDIWKNLVLAEGKPLQSGQVLKYLIFSVPKTKGSANIQNTRGLV